MMCSCLIYQVTPPHPPPTCGGEDKGGGWLDESSNYTKINGLSHYRVIRDRPFPSPRNRRNEMDLATHTLTGLLLSRTGINEPLGRPAKVALVVGAVLPDIDFVAGLNGGLSTLRFHRDLTHSFFGGFLLAMALAGLIYWLSSTRRYWPLVGLSYLGILSHIFLDVITSFGTQVLSPFSRARYALDLVSIIDPYFTAILAFSFLMTYLWRRKAPFFARIGFIALGAYLILSSYNHSRALEKGFLSARAQGVTGIKRAAALPRFYGPFNWAVLIQTENAIYRSRLNLLDSSPIHWEAFYSSPSNPFIQRAEGLQEVRTFLWFSRFPLVVYRNYGEGHIVEYADLRFGRAGPHSPFFLRVVMDRDGDVKVIESPPPLLRRVVNILLRR